MPTFNSHLIQVNQNQTGSTTDGFTESRYRMFSRYLPRQAGTVLDVGCNTGRGGAVLKRINPEWELIGLDCVPERVALLPENIYRRRICGFTVDIPIPDRSVDAVVAGEFIEHLPPEQVTSTLIEFFRVLRLHGILILTTPNPNYIKNKAYGLSVLMDPSHVSQHHPEILRRRLMEIGFSSIKSWGTGRVSEKVGTRLPLFCYGSYMMSARKW